MEMAIGFSGIYHRYEDCITAIGDADTKTFMSEEYLNEIEKRMIELREIDPLNNNKEARKIFFYLPIIPLIDDLLYKNGNVKF